MRFHILVNYKTYTNTEYCGCAFSQLAIRFAKLFTIKGHEVYIYGNGQKTSDVICTKYYEINSKKDLKEFEDLVGSCNSGKALCYYPDVTDPVNIMNASLQTKYIYKASKLLFNNILSKNDFIIHSYGIGHMRIYETFKNSCINVELCVLTDNFLPSHTIFSTRWIHKDHTNRPNINQPISYDIIEPMFDPEDFDPNPIKKDYFLYLARMQLLKGVGIIFELAYQFPQYKFVLAGYLPEHKNTSEYWEMIDSNYKYKKSDFPNITFVGFANVHQKRNLLSEAKALIQLSSYDEPFGFNVIEAYLSMTPVITSNRGAFVETVLESRTGFRCNLDKNNLSDCKYALDNVDKLDKDVIYQEGLRYIPEKVYPKYIKYFKQITKN